MFFDYFYRIKLYNMKVIFIDAYGHLTTEDKSAYKVTLSGSYTQSFGGYWYDVLNIEPKIEVSRLYFKEFLF